MRATDTYRSPFGWWGAVAAGVAVGLGAFGTHLLAEQLTAARLGTFETAVRYQFLHALALLLLHLSTSHGSLAPRRARAIGNLFRLGILFFCGSLYALVATNVGAFGAVAPIGGAALISAWALWAWTLRSDLRGG